LGKFYLRRSPKNIQFVDLTFTSADRLRGDFSVSSLVVVVCPILPVAAPSISFGIFYEPNPATGQDHLSTPGNHSAAQGAAG
jgi:hypothetical protein